MRTLRVAGGRRGTGAHGCRGVPADGHPRAAGCAGVAGRGDRAARRADRAGGAAGRVHAGAGRCARAGPGRAAGRGRAHGGGTAGAAPPGKKANSVGAAAGLPAQLACRDGGRGLGDDTRRGRSVVERGRRGRRRAGAGAAPGPIDDSSRHQSNKRTCAPPSRIDVAHRRQATVASAGSPYASPISVFDPGVRTIWPTSTSCSCRCRSSQRCAVIVSGCLYGLAALLDRHSRNPMHLTELRDAFSRIDTFDEDLDERYQALE